jgi:iron complex transport system ATP-binding protein
MAAREQTVSILGEYAQAAAAPAIVMVTHHVEEIPAGFTHAVLMNQGQIFSAGKIEDTLTSDKVSEVFGFALKVQLDNGRFRVTSAR